MVQREDIIDKLKVAGVLASIRWAYDSASARVLDDYSDATGHDATWIGVTRWVLFRDRLDRAFSCGRYLVSTDADGHLSLDVLQADLSAQDIARMPQIAPGTVVRADVNGSPGWSFDNVRWLLASAKFGRLDEHPWPQKSMTKQRVAMQPALDTNHPTVLDDLTEEEQGGILAVPEGATLDLETLIVGHTLDADQGVRELVIGTPRYNIGGGPAWHWKHDLYKSPPPRGARLQRPGPLPLAPDGVDDASVRLRPPAAVGTQAGDAP